MIKIAICDDDKKKTFYIESLLHQIEKKSPLATTIKFDVSIFFSPEKLIPVLNTNYFDIILLDIEMGKLSGIDVATHIREKLNNQETKLVYISGYDSYFIRLFDTTPSGFIRKPINEDEFHKKITKLSLKILKKRNNTKREVLRVITKSEIHQIPTKEIIYLESKGRKINLITFKNTISYYEKLNNEQLKLAKDNFLRIHQSYLVNLKHITSVRSNEIICVNHAILPISTKYKKEVHTVYLTNRGAIYD